MAADPFAEFPDAPAAPADEFAGFADAPSTAPVSSAATAPVGSGPVDPGMFSTDPKVAGAAARAYSDKIAAAQAGGGDIAPTGNSTEDFIRGAGNAVVGAGTGVRQIALEIGNYLGLVSDGDVADARAGVDAQKRATAPLLATRAGKLGTIAGEGLPMLLMPEAGIVGSAAEGALTGAIQPVGTGDSRKQNAGMGAVGAGVGATLGKVVSTAIGGFGGPGAKQAAADLLDKEGIPTSVGQVTGAKSAQAVERASAITSDDASAFAGEQAQAVNRAVLRRIGVDDPGVTAATPGVMAPAKKAITDVMDSVAARTKPKVDDVLLNDLVQVTQDASRQLPESDIGPITRNVDDIINNGAANNGYLDGTFVQKLNSNLSALMRNPSTAPIASDLHEAVQNAVQRYASPGDAAALMQAQRQYRALKQIEPAIDPATWDISIRKLISSLNSKAYGSRNQMLYARGDQSLVDLVRAAKQVIPDMLGNSGTAERTLPALTALEVAAAGEPIKAGVKAAAGVAGLNAAGAAMRNQGALGSYLKSGIPLVRAAAPAVSKLAAPLGFGAAESSPRDQDEDQAASFATGGRVDHEVLVSRLMNRWHSARKQANKATKPLLNVPDEAITRALQIAHQSSQAHA